MTLEQAKKDLYALSAKMAAYNHATALIFFDGATTAPKGTSANRGQTLSILGEESYNLATGEQTVQLLEFLDSNKDSLSKEEQRMVFLMLKDIRDMQKIPLEEYVSLQKLMVEADDVWHRAKETDDFALFEPVLEKVFDFYKKIAKWCAPEMDSYDYWLNNYETGLNKARCDEFFATLRSKIVPLIKKISEKPQIDDSCIYGDFPVYKQKELSDYLMRLMKIDMDHCGLLTTEHPFTISFGSHHDVRITTNYHQDNFVSSLYSVIHEGGHALYDLNTKDEYAYTALDGGVSMGIHESQSRFYENLIGRSREYVELIFPKVKELFPEQMKNYTAEDLYKAVNKVQPNLIRTEADELTYCLHIMVRYELEKRIFADELSVHDLPKEWNRLYKEYLGIDVPNDKEGVLQDSHWSGGNIGYFPSYALGSAYGVQLLKKMEETVNVKECLKKGDFNPINNWLKENIWQYGSLFTPSELLEKALGEKFEPTVFTDYLEDKFTKLYNL